MSMNTYPVNSICFLIDDEVAAYTALSAARQDGAIPEEISAVLDAGTFHELAKRGELPAGFCDLLCAEADDTCFCSAFHGNAESLFPAWCKEPISNTYENSYIVFINAAREPRLFEAAYASPAQLLDEFQSRFRDKGIEMPPDFDWWAHLVQLNGTTFC